MSSSIDAYNKLVSHKDFHVRMSLANNPNCPVHILKKLANDTSLYVIKAVICNPNCPQQLLLKLAKTNNTFIRWAISNCANKLDEEIISALYEQVTEKETYVLDTLLSHSKCPESIILDSLKRFKQLAIVYIAKNESISNDILDALYKEDNEEVNLTILNRKIVPQSIIESLSKSNNVNIRIKLASRHDLSYCLYKQLIQDQSLAVQASVLNNPNCPEEFLFSTLENTESNWIREIIAKNI